MSQLFKKMVEGYQAFREKYALGDDSIMKSLAHRGQKPQIMIVACCDSRVDPALILGCHPGDLFVVRNVANIVPPYEKDAAYHGTSAALEFGICYLQVKHLIILGHSQCGGITLRLTNETQREKNDFLSRWVSLLTLNNEFIQKNIDDVAKYALSLSYQHCLTFPWIVELIKNQQLMIHRWFFDIEKAEIMAYSAQEKTFLPLEKTGYEF